MKKAYVTPEVIVHGTVEDITQGSPVSQIFGYPGHKNDGHDGGSGPGGPATWPPRRS